MPAGAGRAASPGAAVAAGAEPSSRRSPRPTERGSAPRSSGGAASWGWSAGSLRFAPTALRRRLRRSGSLAAARSGSRSAGKVPAPRRGCPRRGDNAGALGPSFLRNRRSSASRGAQRAAETCLSVTTGEPSSRPAAAAAAGGWACCPPSGGAMLPFPLGVRGAGDVLTASLVLPFAEPLLPSCGLEPGFFGTREERYALKIASGTSFLLFCYCNFKGCR